jgi:hypothetical protein
MSVSEAHLSDIYVSIPVLPYVTHSFYDGINAGLPTVTVVPLPPTFPPTMDDSQDWKLNDNPWQRGYSCCHLKIWDSVKQCLYRYFRVLCLLNWITIPVIPQEKRFLLVFNTTSVPCILHTLNKTRGEI